MLRESGPLAFKATAFSKMARPNRHLGRASLFGFQQNPTTDRPLRKSYSYVDSLILEGRAEWLTEHIAQLLPPEEYLADQRNYAAGGGFSSAWHIRESLGFLTWQMYSQPAKQLAWATNSQPWQAAADRQPWATNAIMVGTVNAPRRTAPVDAIVKRVKNDN
jgi:hypothetical protein